jgi:hypothetical protein
MTDPEPELLEQEVPTKLATHAANKRGRELLEVNRSIMEVRNKRFALRYPIVFLSISGTFES